MRSGTELFAVGAHCTHYHGPLAEGLVVGDTVRCPWHHACFDLRTGEALRAPALEPGRLLEGRAARRADLRQGKARADAAAAGACRRTHRDGSSSSAAARRASPRPRCCGGEGFGGSIVMLSNDAAPPVDRPNLSKDYLAGNAPEDWLPLRPDDFYADNGIELRLNAEVAGIDAKAREVIVAGRRQRRLRPAAAGDRRRAGAAADSRRRPAACAHAALARRLPRHHRRRQGRAPRASSSAQASSGSRSRPRCARAASRFMSWRRSKRPMERMLGPQMGDFVRALHEEHGVVFHLEDTVDGDRRQARDAQERRHARGRSRRRRRRRAAALATRRAGRPHARPRRGRRRLSRDQRARHLRRRRHRALARSAYRREHPRRALGGGRAPGPDRGAQHARAEAKRFDAVPFFWSQHYDVPINYVGHAEQWDEIAIEGDIKAKDCLLRYKRNGSVLAVASIFRDLESLKAELAMERAVQT